MTRPLIHRLARLGVAVVLNDVESLRNIAKDQQQAQLHPRDEAENDAFREALLQCHVFCGFPRTLAAMDVLRDAGWTFADADADADGDPEDPAARGAGLFDTIYGRSAGDVRSHLEGLDPTFARWIAEHAYGRVLTRPSLSAADRELLAVAMLGAMGHDRQLASHARGAVRCGALPPEVSAVIDAVQDLVPEAKWERAHEIVDRFSRS